MQPAPLPTRYRQIFMTIAIGAGLVPLAHPPGLHAESPPTAAAPANPQLNPDVNTALLATPKLENDFYDWYERHEDVLKQVSSRKADLVFIGDSITHMFGGLPTPNRERGQVVWEEFYTPRNALNLGFGFDRIQNVLWRLDHGELAGQTPRVAVILIGTNNLYRSANARNNTPAEIIEGIAAVCDKVHQISPETRVLLLGVFPRGANPDNPHRASISQINQGLEKLDNRPWLTFLDLGSHFVEADGTISKEVMGDALHPTTKGYRIWAEKMEPVLQKLWGAKAE